MSETSPNNVEQDSNTPVMDNNQENVAELQHPGKSVAETQHPEVDKIQGDKQIPPAPESRSNSFIVKVLNSKIGENPKAIYDIQKKIFKAFMAGEVNKDEAKICRDMLNDMMKSIENIKVAKVIEGK